MALQWEVRFPRNPILGGLGTGLVLCAETKLGSSSVSCHDAILLLRSSRTIIGKNVYYRDFVRREGAPLHVTRANPTGLLPSSSSSGHNQTRDLTKKLTLVWTFSFPDFRSSAQSGKNTNACPFNRRNRAIAPRHSPLAKSKATTSSLATQ